MREEHSFYFHVVDRHGRDIKGIVLQGIYFEAGHRCLLPEVHTDPTGRAIVESYSNILVGMVVDGVEVDCRYYPNQLYGFQI